MRMYKKLSFLACFEFSVKPQESDILSIKHFVDFYKSIAVRLILLNRQVWNGRVSPQIFIDLLQTKNYTFRHR